MPDAIAQFLAGFSDPAILFGHFTYALLIASMLMRRMVWLRVLAVGSGLSKVFYRSVLVFDPVSVFWESVFVLVNVVQLLIIWYFEHHHRFEDEARHFADNMPSGVDRGAIRRLLQLGKLRRVDPETILTRQGEPVGELLYIAEGIVKIEAGGRLVAICGPGDYVGELSFVSGMPASATATVVKPTRMIAFDQRRLTRAIAADATVRRTLESALNRNLAGKLARTNNSSEPAA